MEPIFKSLSARRQTLGEPNLCLENVFAPRLVLQPFLDARTHCSRFPPLLTSTPPMPFLTVAF